MCAVLPVPRLYLTHSQIDSHPHWHLFCTHHELMISAAAASGRATGWQGSGGGLLRALEAWAKMLANKKPRSRASVNEKIGGEGRSNEEHTGRLKNKTERTVGAARLVLLHPIRPFTGTCPHCESPSPASLAPLTSSIHKQAYCRKTLTRSSSKTLPLHHLLRLSKRQTSLRTSLLLLLLLPLSWIGKLDTQLWRGLLNNISILTLNLKYYHRGI